MHPILLASILASVMPAPQQAGGAGPPTEAMVAEDEVVVTGRRGSTLDLARLVRAQATFLKYRAAYAPAAALYFELQSSHGLALDGLRLTLRGPDGVVEVPIDASHRFTLPAVAKDGWELVHNRGHRQIALRALVLSPGATEADRPLGDLRLQCRLSRTLNSNAMSLKERLVFDLVGACTSRRVALHFYASRALARATVARGGTTEDLPIDRDNRRYLVPANDTSLPNSARVRLTNR